MTLGLALALTAQLAPLSIAWAAPTASLRISQLDAEAPQSPFLLRLFGARDVALGALTLMAPASTRPTLLKVGVGVDAGDAAAALLALKAGQLKLVPALAMAGTAGFAIFAGVQALGEQD